MGMVWTPNLLTLAANAVDLAAPDVGLEGEELAAQALEVLGRELVKWRTKGRIQREWKIGRHDGVRGGRTAAGLAGSKITTADRLRLNNRIRLFTIAFAFSQSASGRSTSPRRFHFACEFWPSGHHRSC